MNKKDLRIVFFGTPAFAVASLEALVQAQCNVVAVVTAADKPTGRNMKLHTTAVKDYAYKKNIPVLQPDKLRNPEFIEILKNIQADVHIVVAFRMLPEAIWNMPPMGTINVHASLLPQYRGAAPINWAIINGEKETGVTTFKLKHTIDTGNILLQQSIPISETDCAGDIHDTMQHVGATLLLKTLDGLTSKNLHEQPQNNNGSVLQHAPKIFSETCIINWQKTATEIYNFVRGLSPYPTANTFLETKILKVYRCKKEITNHRLPIGTMQTDRKTFLKFACQDGFIALTDIQLEGKKRMLIESFLRGYKFDNSTL